MCPCSGVINGVTRASLCQDPVAVSLMMSDDVGFVGKGERWMEGERERIERKKLREKREREKKKKKKRGKE